MNALKNLGIIIAASILGPIVLGLGLVALTLPIVLVDTGHGVWGMIAGAVLAYVAYVIHSW